MMRASLCLVFLYEDEMITKSFYLESQANWANNFFPLVSNIQVISFNRENEMSRKVHKLTRVAIIIVKCLRTLRKFL